MLNHAPQSRAATAPVRPPAPVPRERPYSTLGLLRALRTNPLTAWTRAHYEEPFLMGNTVMGDLCVINDTAAIRHVLVENAANYRKDALQLRLLGPGLGRGLLTADGEEWRAQRRALAPLFTPRTVLRFRPAMAASAALLVARLQRQREGRTIDIAAEYSRATLDVLERTIFPEGLGRHPSEFIEAVSTYFDTAGRIDPFDILGLPDWLPRFGRRRAAPALAFFAEAVEGIVAARRKTLRDGTGEAEHSDLLTLLMAAADPQTGRGLGESEIRANILTFIGAGHETTANALTWAVYLLAIHPEWRERVEQEVESLREGETAALDPDRLPVLRAVIDETLRLYPPAATLSREAIGPDRIAGHRIRAGTRVVISPWLLHRHRRLWRDPDLFDPSRFLPENREKIDRFAYLPFGAGPRVCIGATFALQEATIMLAEVLRHTRLDFVPGHVVEPVQRISLRPKGGMPVILRHR